MNNIVVPGTIWLASDMHLGPDGARTRQAFLQFLEQAGAQADALFLCGDIFDAWIGDDVAFIDPPPWLQEVLHALASCADQISLWIGRGNRDFLMGSQLTNLVGAQLLTAPVCLHTCQGRVLVSHGDEYCTDDVAYQRFKRIVHTPWIQRAYLRLSLSKRKAIAQWARQRSMATHASKHPDIMDVTPQAVIEAFHLSQAAAVIHGHTHRPALHTVHVHGARRARIVLPDWDHDHEPARSGWAIIDKKGIHLHRHGFATDETV